MMIDGGKKDEGLIDPEIKSKDVSNIVWTCDLRIAWSRFAIVTL